MAWEMTFLTFLCLRLLCDYIGRLVPLRFARHV